MSKLHHVKKRLICLALVLISAISQFVLPCYAASQFSVSPMFQFISLTPGESYVGNFEVVNPNGSQSDFYYKLRIEPFSANDENDVSLTASNGDYNRMVDWIELSETEGVVAPNSSKEVRFTINVPENSPAGGQYASIVVSSDENKVDNNTVDLREVYESAHLIYADVAGETVRKGVIEDVKVPSFLFSGKITGSSRFKNEGNVHSEAYQTIQITPIFSKEEIYTNEENPKGAFLMPGNSFYSTVSWDETPSMGIFHVLYTANYEGVEKKVDKYVIICPIWLLVIILAIIFLILFKILFTGKKDKKEK